MTNHNMLNKVENNVNIVSKRAKIKTKLYCIISVV